MKRELGEVYVEDLRQAYSGRIPGESDLVCYWFEKSRKAVENSNAMCVGLLATQSIRGGANRVVMDRIKESGDIFWAESDREWILEGATVHVSMVGFDDGKISSKILNGEQVESIYSDLTSQIDLTTTSKLKENKGLSFMGVTPSGPFDVDGNVARKWLKETGNPNEKSNADVIRPYFNAEDITDGSRDTWIVDFGVNRPIEDAAEYVAPFEYLKENVKPFRETSKVPKDDPWWLFTRPRPKMRKALVGLDRYIGIPMVSKHHLMTWLPIEVLPANLVIVITRVDDYLLGVLHSWVHEIWARRKGTQLRDAESGSRYTPTTTFQTFPFPWLPGSEPVEDAKYKAIADASSELVEKREVWMNPDRDSEGDIIKRSLTGLYNELPTWLELCHEKLNRAVISAYGWPIDVTDNDILANLKRLNEERSS